VWKWEPSLMRVRRQYVAHLELKTTVVESN